MAGTFSIDGCVGNVVDPIVSSDLQTYENPLLDIPLDAGLIRSSKSQSSMTLPESLSWGMVGSKLPSFMDDYYYRIHIVPLVIELGTFASQQIRQVTLWNAFPYTAAILDDIIVGDPLGITVDGEPTPWAINPLEITVYDITIDSLGPPNVNTTIHFDFTNVPNTSDVTLLGQRAIRFDLIPETGVKETWEWLTDFITAQDGSEQRIALRGGLPRTILDFSVKFTSRDAIAKFSMDLLTSGNSFFVPEWQYATLSTQVSSSGSSRLYYDPSYTDIRAGEYVIVIMPNEASILVEVLTAEVDGCTINGTLTTSIPKGSFVSPGSISLLDDDTGPSRGAVDHFATSDLKATFQRRRSSLSRPGSTSLLTTWNGLPVLTAHPSIEGMSGESVKVNNEIIDNKVGELKYAMVWKYAKVLMSKEFKVSRTPILSCASDYVTHIDYWKDFFAYTRGPQRKFWSPTWRKDFTLLAQPASGYNTLLLREKEYAEKVYAAMPTHRYLEIATTSGKHRCTVTAAIEEGGGTRVVFTPSVPGGAGWTEIQRISFLLPCRVESDAIEFEHFNTHSVLKFGMRTAEI